MRVAAIIGEAIKDFPADGFVGVPVTAGDNQVGEIVEAEVQDGMILTIIELKDVKLGEWMMDDFESLSLAD